MLNQGRQEYERDLQHANTRQDVFPLPPADPALAAQVRASWAAVLPDDVPIQPLCEETA